MGKGALGILSVNFDLYNEVGQVNSEANHSNTTLSAVR